MKKIFFLFLLLFIPKVEAYTYTEYSDFSEPSEEEVTSSNLTFVKEEKRYLYYKINKILGPYSNDAPDYSFIDYDDYILGPESDMSLERPNDKDRIINLKEGFLYKHVGAVSYLKLTNLSDDVNIKGLKIYDGNTQINTYDTTEFLTSDYNLFTGSGTIKNNGFITIEFHENHYLDNLRIEVEVLSDNVNIVYETGNGNVYTKDIINNSQANFEFKYGSLINPEYEYFYDLTRETSNVLMPDSDVLTFYSYQDKIYRHYNIEKIYNDEYTVDEVGDFIYKDEDNYKIYYSYKTRSIIENPVTSDTKTVTLTNLVNKVQDNIDKPLDNIDKPLKEEKASEIVVSSNIQRTGNKPIYKTYEKPKEENNLFYFLYFIFFLVLSIIILVLSKHYKSNTKYVKV